MVKVIHLTSVHPRYDTRIFEKMCKSLNKEYEVNLIVADGKGDEIKDGIKIYDVGKAKDRKERILKTTKLVFKKAMDLDAKVYHLHDPELIPIGLKLKKLGKKVIFDSHEDVPKQILAKHYLNNFLKKILSFGYSRYEIWALKKFDYVVAATPFIRDKFLRVGIKSIDVNNFPKLEDFKNVKSKFKEKNLCYVGTLYKTRGIKEIVKAVEDLDVRLIIAGKFYDEEYEKEVKSLKGWKKVDFRGFVNKNEIKNILENSIAGLVTLYPTPSYIEAYPVKMFEYMAVGIPVIASDFPLYKNFVEKEKCGICVNPLDEKEIKMAVVKIINNIEFAKQMGINGKNAIKNKYNWEVEEKKLFEVYEKVLNEN